MTTIADLGANLLEEAGGFFRNVGNQNQNLREQMTENATVFEQLAELLRNEPEGELGEYKHHELAANLLKDAAAFFRTLGDQNEPIKDQMYENAQIYEQLSALLRINPNEDVSDGDSKVEIRVNRPSTKSDDTNLSDKFNK